MKFVLAAIAAILVAGSASRAAIKNEAVKYQQGGAQFQGYLAYDDAVQGKRPGVLVVPEWWGLNDYARHRAQMLAQLGYVAFVADMYGNGQTTEDPKQAGQWSGALKSNRVLLRQRVNAALEQLKNNQRVDPQKTAAIGYCFGGTSAIELARSGADVKGIVGFHAGLDSPNPADGKNIKGKVLICLGANDTFSSPQDKQAFEDEMRQNHVDWEMNLYGNAVHSFTNPGADKYGIPGIAYNAEADRRSWQAMQDFFGELFGGTPSGNR
jgi:dienelactone hydrolase